MNEELQAFLDEAIAAGKSQDLVLFSLRTAGMDESYVPQVEDYFKKKRPSDSTVSGSQLGLRPSVSESLSSEYIPAGFAPEDIEQQRGEIAKAAAADLYGGIIASHDVVSPPFEKNAFGEFCKSHGMTSGVFRNFGVALGIIPGHLGSPSSVPAAR